MPLAPGRGGAPADELTNSADRDRRGDDHGYQHPVAVSERRLAGVPEREEQGQEEEGGDPAERADQSGRRYRGRGLDAQRAPRQDPQRDEPGNDDQREHGQDRRRG